MERVGCGAAGQTKAEVGLFPAAGGLIEDGAVDFGDRDDDVILGGRGGGGDGEEGEGVELGLGEEAEVNQGQALEGKRPAVVGGRGGGHFHMWETGVRARRAKKLIWQPE